MYWIIFIFLVFLSFLFFVISKLSENTGARAGFVAVSGVILMSAGLIIFSEGLTLPILDYTSEVGGVVNFEPLLIFATAGSGLWIITQICLWLGAVIVLHAVVRAFKDIKENKELAAEEI